MPLSNTFTAEFEQLLARWNQHQQLRHSAAPIADLATSRACLDAARLATSRHR